MMNKSMKIITSLVLLVLLYQSGYAQTVAAIREHTASDKNWKTYSKTDFSVHYPPGWQLDETGQMGTTFIVLSKTESAKDKFRENINLIIQDLSNHNLDLEGYTDLSKKQIMSMFADANLQEVSSKRRHGLNYSKLIYSGTQNGFALKFVQYYWVEKKKAYVLTFTSEQNEFANYWNNTAEKIMDSFVLN